MFVLRAYTFQMLLIQVSHQLEMTKTCIILFYGKRLGDVILVKLQTPFSCLNKVLLNHSRETSYASASLEFIDSPILPREVPPTYSPWYSDGAAINQWFSAYFPTATSLLSDALLWGSVIVTVSTCTFVFVMKLTPSSKSSLKNSSERIAWEPDDYFTTSYVFWRSCCLARSKTSNNRG